MSGDALSVRVTVILITYNHERFISQAIDSILAQQTSFRFEIVILEDCSTDRTRDIVAEYQRQRPDLIRVVAAEANQCDNAALVQAIGKARGEYIALLDGDDYWTSPLKLQRQVEFLDRNPACALCCHNVTMIFDDGSEPDHTNPPDQKEISDVNDLLQGCFVITCSAMLRRRSIGAFPPRYVAENCADWALFLLTAKNGTIGYIGQTMAVYRQHSSGFWTGRDKTEQQLRVIEFYEAARDYVDLQHADIVNTLLARACCQVGLQRWRTSDYAGAQEWFGRARLAQPDLRKIGSILRVAGGCAAQLVFPMETSDAVRVSIRNIAPGPNFNLQLTRDGFRVERNRRYVLRFHARADRNRSMDVGFSQAHEPWQGLGLFRRFDLSREWRAYEAEFTTTSDDSNARVHFDLGETDAAVETRKVVVADVETGENVSLYGPAEPNGEQHLVSVVLPFLNSEQFLREAIESVIAQTYQTWELLLVDDGSTDGSTRIALEYARKYPFSIRYLEHPGHKNLDLAASRNVGVRHARGRYIALLDSDDVWLPGKLAAQVQLLESHPDVGLLWGQSMYWHSWTGDPSDRERDYTPDPGIPTDLVYRPPELLTLLYPLGKGAAPCPSGWLLRREVLDRAGGFEEEFRDDLRMYEDQAFLAKVYLSTPVFISSQCWDRYRIHANSCTSAGRRGGRYSSVRLYFLKWLERYLREHDVRDPSVQIAFGQALRSDMLSEEVRFNGWVLRVAGSGAAQLTASADVEDGVRVAIDKPADIKYDIQLNCSRLNVQRGHRYAVVFQARADGQRTIHIGFAEGHQPWAGLGLYQALRVLPAWQNFRVEFVATNDDVNGRIHFDLGGAPEPVEFRSVALLHLPDGMTIEPGEQRSDSASDKVSALAGKTAGS